MVGLLDRLIRKFASTAPSDRYLTTFLLCAGLQEEFGL